MRGMRTLPQVSIVLFLAESGVRRAELNMTAKLENQESKSGVLTSLAWRRLKYDICESDEMDCVDVERIRSTDCDPSGDNSQNSTRIRLTTVIDRNLTCVIIVPPTVRLPIKRSRKPSEVPFSNLHDASLIIPLPTIAEKHMGKSVAAFKT